MMRLRRDILLIILAVVLAAFGTIVPSMIKNWTPITAIPYLVIVGALVFAIWSVVKGIRVIDEREETRQKDETKQLIKDTVKETLEKLGIKNKY